MADLDDFFAKKDKKKSKSTVKKFPTADELAKKLDDPKKKVEVKPKREKPIQEGEEGSRRGEEEEWREYEETVKDYTGLKIQVLQGGAGQQNSGEGNEDSGSLSGHEGQGGGGKGKGPWNKTTDAPEKVVARTRPARVVKEPAAASDRYVPPSHRLAQRQEPTPRQRAQLNKNAPDINNDDYFPVLGGQRKQPSVNANAGPGSGWSTATGAGTNTHTTPTQNITKVQLANRFTTLTEDS